MKERLGNSLKAYYNGYISHDCLMDSIEYLCKQDRGYALMKGVIIGLSISIGIGLCYLSI